MWGYWVPATVLQIKKIHRENLKTSYLQDHNILSFSHIHHYNYIHQVVGGHGHPPFPPYLWGEDILTLILGRNPNLRLQVGHGSKGVARATAALISHRWHVAHTVYIPPVKAVWEERHAGLLLGCGGGRDRAGVCVRPHAPSPALYFLHCVPKPWRQRGEVEAGNEVLPGRTTNLHKVEGL